MQKKWREREIERTNDRNWSCGLEKNLSTFVSPLTEVTPLPLLPKPPITYHYPEGGGVLKPWNSCWAWKSLWFLSMSLMSLLLSLSVLKCHKKLSSPLKLIPTTLYIGGQLRRLPCRSVWLGLELLYDWREREREWEWEMVAWVLV